MDIDVKNSLDRLMAACSSIEAAVTKANPLYRIKDLVIQDIYAFIHIISKTRAGNRIEYFCAACLNGKYPAVLKSPYDEEEIPESMILLCRFDINKLCRGDIKTTELFIAFVTELGRYYLRAGNDKDDIDSTKFLEYIKRLKKYSDEQLLFSMPDGAETEIDVEKTKAEDVLSADENRTRTDENASGETLEDLMEQLNHLIGLTGVKQEVSSLINMIRINKIREARNLPQLQVSRHLVFLGNPGTGKTTVARILSKIYKCLGALEKGQLVEVDRAGLVAGYVGQTALKTKEKIDEAMGGILFIDEAYTLAKGGNDFGQEAIDTILKAMEDKRDAFIVIVAGYPEQMKAFLESNPGLKSRFNKSILFEDYSKEELLAIFEVFCEKYGMHLSKGAQLYLRRYLDDLYDDKPENFANGREMRNLFEGAISNQVDRLASYTDISDAALNEITEEDLSFVKA